MSRIDLLVWIAARQVWMAFAEKMSGKRSFVSCALFSAVLLASVAVGALPAGALDPGALPTGGHITAGKGNISVSGSQMTVTQQQNKMIANWDTFNIGKNAGVTFVQPNSSSVVLNKILDQNPSQIFGSLKANGQVFLLNPSGIVFGSTARVDVGGIVASSLHLSDEDFLSGHYQFNVSGITGGIVNQGIINTADYGVVALIAPQVTNQGTITAPKGSVALAAGNRVALDFVGDGLIKVSVDETALNAAVGNSGAIKADGGQVFMTAKAAGDLMATVVNNTGVIEANSITDKNGVIVLDGGSQGIVSNSGTISASGKNAGETGGTVTMTGDKVGLLAGSSIDASGFSGGGTVNIGGGWQGADSKIHNANAVYMAPGANIFADAIKEGNGGTVALWSENYTNFQGSISAKGGALWGNGGQVETSSRDVLIAAGSVTTFAPNGQAGTWLLDPSQIMISNYGSGTLTGGVYDPPSSLGMISPATILAGLKEGNVTILTHGGSGGNGNITLIDSINTNSDLGGAKTLTLKADSDILFNPFTSIDASTGGNNSALNVVLWSNFSNEGGSILMAPGSKINSHGGNITLGGGTDINTGFAQGKDGLGDLSSGITLVNAQLLSEGGDITLKGKGAAVPGEGQFGRTGSFGVVLAVVPGESTGGDTLIDSGSGKISITGVGALASESALNGGVVLAPGQWVGGSTNTVTIQSANNTASAITIVGDSSQSTASSDSAGLVLLNGSTIQATNGGGITLIGKGGSGSSVDNAGVLLIGNNVLANSGPITIQGSEGVGINNQSILSVGANVGQAAGTAVPSSSSNITLIGDSMLFSGGSYQSSGTLTIKPEHASTPIAVGPDPALINIGANFKDNLVLPASLFSGEGQVFSGFSSTTIGSTEGTGAILIGAAGWPNNFPNNVTILNTGSGSNGIKLEGVLTADGNITLATLGHFTNTAGASALVANDGDWLLYTPDSSHVTADGLVPAFTQFSSPYPTPAKESGDGFLFSVAPPTPEIDVTSNLVTSIQASLTATQTTLNTPSTTPLDTDVQTGTGGILAGASQPTSLTLGMSAGQLKEQGLASQKSGDFKNAVVNFKEAADLLLQQASLPQAREAIELMKTAELQEYFQDAGIVVDQTHKTRLKDVPKDTAVVYALIFPQRIELILSSCSGIKRYTVPIDAQMLSKDINSLRASLQRRTRWDYLAESQKFYNLLVKPLEMELNVCGINTVIFMPDGVLRTVPFAALHDGSRFLIEKYAVAVTPSLDLTDPRSIRRTDTRVLSAGLTESVQGFAALSNVKDELDGIQGLYRADRLENNSFSGANVRASLKDNPYSIVHIATHGNFAPSGSDTYLLVWDGKIDMNQLDQLMKPSGSRGPVELLSLSACETAVGDDKAALGLAGVAVKAGARSALATLWSVNDQAASELVLEFYKELKNPAVTKAEALQAAQLKLMDDARYRHPYYWSPFLLIGNWL
ncbi:MAG: CHAT domain-containing protein [Syntrophobacteraceae bacterium]